MSKNVLIVESPAKAKTIEKYLGKDFQVKSSYGHIRDLEKSNMGVDIDKGFEPHYKVTSDKKKVVAELKKAIRSVDNIWLATDEDREGEAISWHLCQVLDLDLSDTKRIVFREITKPAIQNAIQNPRTVDLHLVNAQQARRILDRLVGFELSEILWKKIRNKLSAGRVQSVALRLLVEREREIIAFESSPFFRVYAYFSVEDADGKETVFRAELPGRFEKEGDALEFLEKCKRADFEIEDIEKKPIKRRPTPPFTTSTLQQEASRKLGFSVSRTMSAAQRLYENGMITYMRTDSVKLSETAIQQIAGQIKSDFGDNYLKTRRYRGKKQLTQEAHEAIRPTYVQRKNVSGNRDEQRLYELIWKRTVASQMSEAILEKTTVKIGVSTVPEQQLEASGQVIKFDGFLKVYFESKDDDGDDYRTKDILPPLKMGQDLDLDYMQSIERFTRPPARYTEAKLVKKLEELGIGRPSTYAPTISKLMDTKRGYITKESREGEQRKYKIFILKDGEVESKTDTEITGATSKRLYPSDIGMVVTDFLSEHFGEIMDYEFTAKIEEQFDAIAAGDMEWRDMLKYFYKPFHEQVEQTIEKADRATGKRILGTHPKSGKTVLTRMTKYGPVAQIGDRDELDEGEKPEYANLKKDQSIETITLEEALELFKLPRKFEEYEGKEVEVNSGRYGPYVRWGDTFISLPKDEEPIDIKHTKVIELIEQKKIEDEPIAYYKEKPVRQGKGRYGPYVKWNDMYVNIPKKIDPEELTEEQAIELIEKKLERQANRYIHQWPKEKIAVENGRWGPFIRYKRKSVSLPKKDGKKMTVEEAKELTLEEVKEIIEEKIPNAFGKKKKGKKKKKSSEKSSEAEA